METQEKVELDSLLADYKSAVDEWRAAIRAEEDFATPDHSMKEWEALGEGEGSAAGLCGRAPREALQLLISVLPLALVMFGLLNCAHGGIARSQV